jgi:hypothetical protein
MMRLIIKLVIAALLANAVYRVGSEYVTYFKFRDAIRDAAMFKAKSEDDLRTRIMALADDYDVPVDADSLEISRDERVWSIDGSYTKPIEILPRYEYPWKFSWSMEAVTTEIPPLPGAPQHP